MKNHTIIIFVMIVLFSDVDECLSDSQNDCAESADCINEEGSYSCQCQEGFTGNGRTCSGILCTLSQIECGHLEG